MMKQHTLGWLNGMVGVAIFSGSLPATRVAVQQLSPWFVTGARACIAAALGALLLQLLQQARPQARQWASLGMVAIGVVLGFPLLTALALQHASSAHTIVFIGLLPLCTAMFAVWRGGERPSLWFWLFAVVGGASVAAYALMNSDGAPWYSDALMVAAIIVCGMGYAEGAKLSHALGGWQVISWALLLSVPIMLPLALWSWPDEVSAINANTWWGLAYVSLFSMLIGFVFWYKGLAQGGIAAVGQLQLLQPFMGLALAALLLGETVNFGMVVVTLFAVVCVAGAKRTA
ncbi:DMT family transporter [Vitreoscilla massiliensis]|uniref:DMT family transporter n=1 Tax=Vitreoscilla massiliensis TaxID=1689272 RepID=A0ABY4E0P6_9NEIS|nr:DMT family transporter [Vitreoscilla massiliensis]UOO88365.1 DMT family transporter [Vitreoscilla massiliensis]